MLRHGRTAWNADGRFQGHTDVPLDETGRAQAAGLAALLANEHFDRALSSDLVRASETTAIVVGARSLALELDSLWREMRFGAWEGLTWSQIVERFPDVAEHNDKVPAFYTPQGGETFEAVCERVSRALAAIRVRARNGDRILVGTHAGTLHALLRVALGESEATALRVRFEPGTVTRLALEGNAARLVALNVSGR